MNVFSLGPFYRVVGLIKGILSFLCRILFRKKKIAEKCDEDKPIEIISVGTNSKNKDYGNFGSNNEAGGNSVLVDWSDWKEPTSAEDTKENLDSMNLFEDMEPKLTRPRMLKVSPSNPPDQKAMLSSNRLQVSGTSFEVQSELGTWVENSSGWDEEVLDDLSEEAANILKEKKKMERQRRTIEQKKRNEELRAMRADRKNAPHLGMKVN
ncbi:receptor-binding cancer antigen expressed on SiSo cells-like [Rhopilema esculentum]|uniref:receptor-binding cancer antigen expressed on SiSo cells-like n=1 Tax=Rhopilema esculentum TaxID=499914 RepID=UPI0031DC9FC0